MLGLVKSALLHLTTLKYTSVLYFHLCLGLLIGVFGSGWSTKITYVLLIFHTRTKSSVLLIFLDPSNHMYEILINQKVNKTSPAVLLMTCLTLYVLCIVTNYMNKPTRCTFCTYLFYNFYATLRVSKDHFVHHQEFMIYCILQLCTNHANVSNCSVLP